MEYIKHLGIVLPEKKTFFKNSIKCTSSEDCIWLNEKVIAIAVSTLKKGYSTEDMMFIYLFSSLSSDNAGCQVKNKMANHMALNSHDMSWNSFLHTCIIYLLQTEFHSCC